MLFMVIAELPVSLFSVILFAVKKFQKEQEAPFMLLLFLFSFWKHKLHAYCYKFPCKLYLSWRSLSVYTALSLFVTIINYSLLFNHLLWQEKECCSNNLVKHSLTKENLWITANNTEYYLIIKSLVLLILRTHGISNNLLNVQSNSDSDKHFLWHQNHEKNIAGIGKIYCGQHPCILFAVYLGFLSDVGLRLELANCKILIKLEDECEVTELI